MKENSKDTSREDQKLQKKINFTNALMEKADKSQQAIINILRNLLLVNGRVIEFSKEETPTFCPTYHQQGLDSTSGLLQTSMETAYHVKEVVIDRNNILRFLIAQYKRVSNPIEKFREVIDSKGNTYLHGYWVPGGFKDEPKPKSPSVMVNAYDVPMSVLIDCIQIIKQR